MRSSMMMGLCPLKPKRIGFSCLICLHPSTLSSPRLMFLFSPQLNLGAQPVSSRRAPVAGRDYRVGDLRGCREGRRGARHHLHRHPRSVRGEAHLHGARHQNSRGWRQTKEMQTRPYLVEKRKQMYQNFLIIL